jgi:hypothetical protein
MSALMWRAPPPPPASKTEVRSDTFKKAHRAARKLVLELSGVHVPACGYADADDCEARLL